MLPVFDLKKPTTLAEALENLYRAAPSALPIAGGTNLLVDMRSRRVIPNVLVDLGKIEELTAIVQDENNLSIGGGVPIGDLLKSHQVRANAPALYQAARVFANPLIRSRATLGGNLADGSPAADSAPALLVHDAKITLQRFHDLRVIPLKDFFLSVRQTSLMPDELITSIQIPLSKRDCSSAFYKLGLRKADAISIASVAVYVEEEDGRAANVRIAMGSVAPVPMRAFEAENILLGMRFNPSIIQMAGEMAAQESNPISDVRGSENYRRRMVSVLTRRLLTDLSEKLGLLEI